MSTDKPVVIYGASGYTGRLVAEYCREYSLPFLAVGRDEERVTSVVERVPGITEVEHSVAAVEHTVDALAEAIDGAKVVINTVGPFLELGHPVVEACGRVGAHYLDTNGEQPWMMEAEERHGAAFAEAGLALAPGVAQMYTGGEIAANLALETPGLDTLDIVVLWKGAPTTASTETIFSTLMTTAYYLEDNAYVAWPDGVTTEVAVPGRHDLAMTTPWSGTAHPVWFKGDGRVQTVKAYGGVFDRGLMNVVKQITDTINEQVKPLPTEEARRAAIAEIKKQVAAPMPPRENARSSRCGPPGLWAPCIASSTGRATTSKPHSCPPMALTSWSTAGGPGGPGLRQAASSGVIGNCWRPSRRSGWWARPRSAARLADSESRADVGRRPS